MGERPPIHSGLSSLKKVILKALTENQILLLNEVEKNSTKTITTLVNRLSKSSKVPLSTLKLNARMLKELELVRYCISEPVELTDSGKFVLKIIGDE